MKTFLDIIVELQNIFNLPDNVLNPPATKDEIDEQIEQRELDAADKYDRERK